MVVLDRDGRLLVTLATVGIALATLFGAAASAEGSVSTLVIVAVGLIFAVARAGARRSTSVLPPGKDVVVLTAVTVLGLVAVYVAGWNTSRHLVPIAQLLPIAVMGLAMLWPEPNVLRYCLLLASGALLGTVGEPGASTVAVGGAVAALAVALVATHRLTSAGRARLGGAAPARGRRVAAEAAAVLAIVGLLAAFASSLLPPPAGEGGGGLGDARPASLPRPAAPSFEVADAFDVTAGHGAPNDDVVFLVAAQKADVWRATTYDRWDGELWSRSRDVVTELDEEFVEPGIGDVEVELGPGSGDSAQSVIVLARSTRVLVAAARPAYASADVVLRQGADATLYPAPPLPRGDEYTVLSDGSQAQASVLRAIGDPPVGAVPTDVAEDYLQLPQVSPRVRAVAGEVSAGASTTYGKVRAVERWIDDRTTVTRDAQPIPPGSDPLEVFLLEERSGPPERAATGMAVMLRALGIPARIAIGFLPGTRTGPDRQFLVRSRDAHAWVEVWFPTVGWQRFDPTGKAPDAHAAESLWDRLLRFVSRLWPLVVLVALVVGGWFAWGIARWWRRRTALPWATRFFARLERAGAARGRPRRAQETPVEYANALAEGALPDPRLREVGDLVTLAAWSRHQPPAEDRAGAEAVLKAARKAAPVRRLSRRSASQPAQGPRIAKP